MDTKELRRALLTLQQAGELELQHLYGEMQSVWNARESVQDFLRDSSDCLPTEIARENHDALVRLHELGLMLGRTLRMTRAGWDCIEGEFDHEPVLEPINQIAKEIGEAIPPHIVMGF